VKFYIGKGWGLKLLLEIQGCWTKIIDTLHNSAELFLVCEMFGE
jgi:hypothetical protein